MSPKGPAKRTLTICNRLGLHARAAAKFVRTSENFEAALTVTRDGVTVGANSIMGLMMLAAGQGAEIVVEGRGADAAEALGALEELVDGRFGED